MTDSSSPSVQDSAKTALLDEKTEEAMRALRSAYRGMHCCLTEEEDDISRSEDALRRRIGELVEEARIDERRRPLFWERARQAVGGS